MLPKRKMCSVLIGFLPNGGWLLKVTLETVTFIFLVEGTPTADKDRNHCWANIDIEVEYNAARRS